MSIMPSKRGPEKPKRVVPSAAAGRRGSRAPAGPRRRRLVLQQIYALNRAGVAVIICSQHDRCRPGAILQWCVREEGGPPLVDRMAGVWWC